jgi:MtN3 and saliva related transmembrane protein
MPYQDKSCGKEDENMTYVIALGLVAGALTSLCEIPQIYRIWKRKSADDVSYKMYLLLSAGVVLWIVYGILEEQIAVVITNVINLVLNSFLLYLKWKYRGKKTTFRIYVFSQGLFNFSLNALHF